MGYPRLHGISCYIRVTRESLRSVILGSKVMFDSFASGGFFVMKSLTSAIQLVPAWPRNR